MWLALLALLYSGVVQALISPPLSWVVLHPLSWVPAFWVFWRLNGRRAFLAGWCVGASANLAIFYWLIGTVHRFGGLPVPVAVGVWLLFAAATGFYTAVFAWGFGPIRRVARGAWPFAIAAWFCALEFINPQLFPYYQGVAWYQLPSLFLLTAFTGVAGISFLVMLCNGVVVQILEAMVSKRGSGRRCAGGNAAIGFGLLAAATAYSALREDAVEQAEARAPSLRLALVQPNHTIERRREMAKLAPEAFAADLLSQSRAAQSRQARTGEQIDVFVWPEGALRREPAAPRNRAVIDFARASGVEIWTGANHLELGPGDERSLFNSAFRVDTKGVVHPRYDKNILIPFGEYVPLRDVIPGFDRIKVPGAFAAGEGLPLYDAGPARFVFLICYEAIRSAFVREGIRGGANLLVNVTVDAWYGDGSEQSQHLMLAAIQSAQYGVPLVRSTTTGISAFVDARGMITSSTGVYTRETLVGEVRLVRIPSLYGRVGDWFAVACIAVSAILVGLASRASIPLRQTRVERNLGRRRKRRRRRKARR